MLTTPALASQYPSRRLFRENPNVLIFGTILTDKFGFTHHYYISVSYFSETHTMSRITQQNEDYGNSSEQDSENLPEEADQDNMNQSTSSWV